MTDEPVTTPLLEARNIRVSFAARQGVFSGLLSGEAVKARAVDGVSLSIASGEIVALAGESGCGKTTLARTIMGLQAPETQVARGWWWAISDWLEVLFWVLMTLTPVLYEKKIEKGVVVLYQTLITGFFFKVSPIPIWVYSAVFAIMAIAIHMARRAALSRSRNAEARARKSGIFLDGSPIATTTRALRKYRKRVQLIFQDPAAALNPRQTIYESVAEGLRIHKVPGDEEELVANALSKAGLRPPQRFFLLYPHEVSGGQRQRVVIAGALALEPDLLVADEPVSALDASVRGEILKLLLGLRDDLGLAILVVTHDLGLAWMIADRVAVMYLGRIVEIGPAEKILTSPQHPYTQALLSVVPETKNVEQIILTGEPPDPTRIPAGCRFHERCQLVASGKAAELGIEERCRTEDLDLAPAAADHLAACHAVKELQ